MAKILITENQLKNINNLVKEDLDNTYRREVKVYFNHHNTTFKGREISDINAYGSVIVYFLIDVEGRSWGIKDVSLYNIKGEETLKVIVDYYINDLDEDQEVVNLKLNWDEIETEVIKGEGIITVGDTLQIDLTNDENGDLVVEAMGIEVYSL